MDDKDIQVDFKKLYEQDPDFAAYCKTVILVTLVNDEGWLKTMYGAYQSGATAEQVAKMLSFINRFGPLPPQQP